MLKSAVGKVMWVGRATVFLVGLAVILALVLGVSTTALGATGGQFILGKPNDANKPTTLSGILSKATQSALVVVNKSTGSALDLRVTDSNSPPMKVNSSAKVTKLNADLVDGLDASQLQGPRAYAHVNADGTIDTADSKNVPEVDVSDREGRYCFSGLGFTPKNVMVTLDPGSIMFNNEIATAWADTSEPQVGGSPLACPTAQASVLITRNSNEEEFKAEDFFVVFN